MNGRSKAFFDFDAFRMDIEERTLRRNGEIVVLTPRVFDILMTLIENHGETVEKDVLMQRVWPDTFVEEGNLHHHVSVLRKTLGDDPRGQRLIKTIPKRGYRFTGQVRQTIEADENVRIGTLSRGELLISEETREGFWTTSRIAILAAGLIIISFVAAWATMRYQNGVAAASHGSKITDDAADLEKGRALWQTRNPADLHQATLLLERAVEFDPTSARVHAALADAYAFDYTNWKKAEDEANQAITLDATLGEPHATLGFVRTFWKWELLSAEPEFKRAEELSPNYGTTHQWYALNLVATAHGDAALAEIRRAVELEPDSVSINADLCHVLYYNRMYDAALAQCKKVTATTPLFVPAHQYLFEIYFQKKMYDEAVTEFLAAEDIENATGSSTESDRKRELRAAYEKGGIRGFLSTLAERSSGSAADCYRLAQINARLGEDDKALDWLYKAYDVRDFNFIFLQMDPVFERFHDDPRLAALKDRLLR